MRFIGRKDDLAFLEKAYASRDAQLVVMYGRRRVGKTECLRQFAQDKDCVWYSCSREPDALQLRAFSRRLLARDALAARFIDTFATWTDALAEIPRLDGDGRKLVIIDEFPYAVAGNAALPSVLQAVWDETLCRADVMLVLCGSSLSFMEDDLLSERNPLYGRATGIWKMEPLEYPEATRFFPGYTAQEKLEAYGILGGVPHYLRQFDPGLTVSENVRNHILSRGCALYTEVDFLLRQELREPAIYNAVLGAVASGETELNGIAQKSMLDTRTAHTYLRKLQELRLVDREFSVQAGRQERAKQQRGLWRINDNFVAFWFAAVQPYVSELDAGAADAVWTQIVQPRLNDILAVPFEAICRQWVRRQNARNKLPFFYRAMGRWWSGPDEIDAVALGESHAHLLCECKFNSAPVGQKVLRDLRAKGRRHFLQGEEWDWLFSKCGYADGGSWADGEQNVRLVMPEELEEG